MLQSVSSVFVVYRRKTLTGSPDPTHGNGMDKPCKVFIVSVHGPEFKRSECTLYYSIACQIQKDPH